MSHRALKLASVFALIELSGSAMAQTAPSPAQSPSAPPAAVTSPTTPPSVMPGSPAPNMQPVKADRTSQQFVIKAIQGNYAEIALGKLASTKATAEPVKAYGSMLTTDHGQANEKAITLARSVGVDAPKQASAKQQKMYDRLAKFSGTRFDTEFMKHMVTDHREDIRDYKKGAAVKTAQVADYARETMPTLQKHLDQAIELNRAKPAQQSSIR